MIKYSCNRYTNLTDKGINHAKNRTIHIKIIFLKQFYVHYVKIY